MKIEDGKLIDILDNESIKELVQNKEFDFVNEIQDVDLWKIAMLGNYVQMIVADENKTSKGGDNE